MTCQVGEDRYPRRGLICHNLQNCSRVLFFNVSFFDSMFSVDRGTLDYFSFVDFPFCDPSMRNFLFSFVCPLYHMI